MSTAACGDQVCCMPLAIYPPHISRTVCSYDYSEGPLLAASLTIGETTDGAALLGIEVGCVQLALSVPQGAVAELAYAMLAATAGRRLPT